VYARFHVHLGVAMKSFILAFLLLKFLQVELICVLVCKLFKCHSNLGRLNLDHCLLVLHHHFMCMCGISLKPFLFGFLFLFNSSKLK
jgi:hypothetical protein